MQTHWLFTLAQLPGEHGPSMFSQFMAAGPMAKFVFVILVGMSIGSWAIIFGKLIHFRKMERSSDRFLDVFRQSQRFSDVHAAADGLEHSPLVGLFQAGYVEIDAQVKASRAADSSGAAGAAANAPSGYRLKSLDGLQRSLRRAVGVEQKALSRGTGFLATTAAASPFIGLFGTVWGIMVAFGDIGASGSTALAVVAPGIAEALVNTAAGLGAAIPALIGFNYFSHAIRENRAEMEDFVLEFVNLAERNFT